METLFLIVIQIDRDLVKFVMPLGTGEMALALRAFTALAEDPGSVPSIHVKELTTVYNSKSRESKCPLTSTKTYRHINSCRYAHK